MNIAVSDRELAARLTEHFEQDLERARRLTSRPGGGARWRRSASGSGASSGKCSSACRPLVHAAVHDSDGIR